jgi:hypothetical protein
VIRFKTGESLSESAYILGPRILIILQHVLNIQRRRDLGRAASVSRSPRRRIWNMKATHLERATCCSDPMVEQLDSSNTGVAMQQGPQEAAILLSLHKLVDIPQKVVVQYASNQRAAIESAGLT